MVGIGPSNTLARKLRVASHFHNRTFAATLFRLVTLLSSSDEFEEELLGVIDFQNICTHDKLG